MKSLAPAFAYIQKLHAIKRFSHGKGQTITFSEERKAAAV